MHLRRLWLPRYICRLQEPFFFVSAFSPFGGDGIKTDIHTHNSIWSARMGLAGELMGLDRRHLMIWANKDGRWKNFTVLLLLLVSWFGQKK